MHKIQAESGLSSKAVLQICFILLFICLQKSPGTWQKTIPLARGKHDSKRHSLIFPQSSANAQRYRLAKLLGRLTERLPSYPGTVMWAYDQNSSHAGCFATLHNNVSILPLYQGYSMKSIVLSNLELFSGWRILRSSLLLEQATIVCVESSLRRHHSLGRVRAI